VLSWIGNYAAERRAARGLFEAIVGRALDSRFFGPGRVEDTLEGRLELIMVHLFLVVDRFLEAGRPGRRQARRLNELYVVHVDDCLREMGVADLRVPKKVKAAAAALQVRCKTYRAALKEEDGRELCAALAAFMPGLDADKEQTLRLADYVRKSQGMLSAAPLTEIVAGRAAFPPASAE
jgi:cytochrome b pre-mRNA-processing protein 3